MKAERNAPLRVLSSLCRLPISLPSSRKSSRLSSVLGPSAVLFTTQQPELLHLVKITVRSVQCGPAGPSLRMPMLYLFRISTSQ
jgi:hypothetical protein